MDPALEVRKLKPSQIQDIAMILETHQLWKNLMSKIPKFLQRFNYNCKVSSSNPYKYNAEHFKIIEHASLTTKRYCTEILLEEWGTSGRVLPTLGHLFYLLIEAQLFRAAEYVADLLNWPKPQRPEKGPAAVVAINLPDSSKADDELKRKEIEDQLNKINYPSEAVKTIIESQQVSKETKPTIIPKIVITPNDEDKTNTSPNYIEPIVIPKEIVNDTKDSDMVQFPKTISKFQEGQNVNADRSNKTEMGGSDNSDTEPERDLLNSVNHEYLPVFDILNNSEHNTGPEIIKQLNCENIVNLPDISMINNLEEHVKIVSSETFNPALSELLIKKNDQVSTGHIPILSDLLQSPTSHKSLSNSNIPNFSMLQTSNSVNINNNTDSNIYYSKPLDGSGANEEIVLSSDEIINTKGLSSLCSNIPDLSALKSSSCSLDQKVNINDKNSSLPVFSELCEIQNLDVETGNKIIASSDSNSRPCNSPLPQLSLNTQLPHFSYNDLIMATNNFNKNLYIDEIESGRFLGSGAFGSVFLGFGLFEKPVAVKKLVLENVDYVDIDATVTKQFKNEVEVLSHYKHPNLLSLVGYSCDGCTYCLLYEYIQGGALSVRLQASHHKLQWKERIKIALGTASAVVYLHTAFSTPLIHRDIKSANILLDCSNTPKLCDFGLIKLSPSQNTATATTVFGTSAYMAPEAFRGDISVKIDTFSFGVVLLELLTSLPPIDEKRNGFDLITHVLENCAENCISSLLDKGTGSWLEDEINYDKELYKIAILCLEEKKKRPNMVTVKELLSELSKNLFP